MAALLDQRLDADELMDDPALPEDTYRAVLADLAQVNRVTLAYRPTLRFLEHALAGRQRFSLLDVGFGQGDMLRRIASWAQQRGIEARLIGVDLNPRSEAAARAATPGGQPITYVTGDYADLTDEPLDFVISSLVAHHMTRAQLLAFLAFMDTHTRIGWFVNDLHRHRLSHAGYPLLAAAAGWHPIVRADGRTSIARSFRAEEWRHLLQEAKVSGARIERRFPFRLCVGKVH